jgi:hypothetical protein
MAEVDRPDEIHNGTAWDVLLLRRGRVSTSHGAIIN